jgi:hypothetical protein
LAPLLDQILRGWDHKDKSAIAKVKLRIGEDVCKRLRTTVKSAPQRFSAKQKTKVGHWLYKQAMMGLDIFDDDENEMPLISDKHLDDVASLREWMIAHNPSFAPRLKPPQPWTGCSKTCDGFEMKFVKDWSGETDAAIEAAFSGGNFEHAGGVNSLAQVAIVVDPVMVDLVERFAPDIMGNTGRKLKADKVTVAADVTDARWCVEHGTFWLDYNCDFRGRLNPLQNLNFTRGDHVRSLLRFAHGLPINGETRWLEIHCANRAGRDKESIEDRLNWVGENREDIERIAADPVGTRDKIVLGDRGWQSAEDPFQFVAACRELDAAWKDPQNFITHLPVSFDGSCNGIQHLALLSQDNTTARLVNLLPAGDSDKPYDIYAHVIAKTIELIDADPCDHAVWWRERFKQLDTKQKRKLLKRPIMTFGYSVTDYGACRQISEAAYRDLDPFTNEKPPKGAFMYLAKKVREACKQELPGAKWVMDYICMLAKYCLDDGRFLTWVSPSGFPVENRYLVPNMVTVNCMSGSVRVRHNIADGVTDKIDRYEVKNGAAPNFVHSLDAAHLVRVVNAAVSEGITSLATIHDCFLVLSPQASRLHRIILEELAGMYTEHDPLEELRSHNVSEPDVLPVPPRGNLLKFVNRILSQSYWVQLLSIEEVKEAKNAFG